MAGICFELLIRSTVVLGAALLLASVPRLLSAAQRHCVLALGLVVLLLWPAIGFWIPEWHVGWPMNEAHAGDGIVTVRQFLMDAKASGNIRFEAQALCGLWLAGFSMAMLPLMVGLVRVRSMVRQSMWSEDLEGIAVMVHPGDTMPLTCGVLRGRILLPAGSSEWPEQLRRDVLLHERAHVKRRDVAMQVVAHVGCAVWWFQPLVWLGLRQLRRESERACDEQALAQGVTASEYAGSLLEIARRCSHLPVGSVAAVGIVAGSEVHSRIRGVLANSSPRGDRRHAIAAVFLSLFSTAAGMALTVAAPQSTTRTEGENPTMKRALLFALAGISTQAYPTAAAAMPRADVKQEGTKNAGPIRVKSDMMEANVVHKVPPVYPPSAKAAGITGTVVLDVSISREGVPEDVKVISSPSPELSDSAVAAVRQWRYRSTLLNGEPVDVIGQVTITYSLTR